MGATEQGGLGGFALITADDAEALAERLADDVAERLARALEGGAEASLVLSGGSTPKPLFARLATRQIDWGRVAVTLADERWVPPDHPDSNERLVRAMLLTGPAAAARFVGLYRAGPSPEATLEELAVALETLPRPFTVTLLGMGADGHTASLFPDAAELEEGMAADARAAPVALMRPASVPQARLTLTRAALVDSEALWLHVTGEEKREVLARALATAPAVAPIARVLREASPDRVRLYWSR